jgi:hypothetical protein
MSYQTTTYRILIASPSDLTLARKAITEVIYRWNGVNSDYYKVSLLPVKWETDAAPEVGDRPQEIINRQLVKNCDILIGIFWTRIGTKTIKAESGTVEEIKYFIKMNKPVMIYFSSEPIDPKKIDSEQKKRLDKFEKEIKKIALVENYKSISELKDKLDRQLTKTIKDTFIYPKSIDNNYSSLDLFEKKDLKKQDNKHMSLLNKPLHLLSNLENILQPKTMLEMSFLDFLDSIYNNLKLLKPEFSQYKDNYDEVIINQINNALPIDYTFIKASLLVSKAKNLEAIKTIYNYFSEFLKLCEIPEGFSGSYSEYEFDGFRFIVYEIFVAFVSCLIKYDNWKIIDEIFNYDLFFGRDNKAYVPFPAINQYNYSLDAFRNQRLKLQRTSIMSDMLKDRFTNSNLSKLLTHRDFMEADYFLFLKSLCRQEKLCWCPRSCVYLYKTPRYILKSESQFFLNQFIEALSIKNSEDLTKLLKSSFTAYKKCFSNAIFIDIPLEGFDLDILGTRK